jgi:type I restriction enzyme S subunit
MIEGLQPYSKYKDSGLPWLGRCPSHWVIKRGKSYMTCVDQRSKAGKEELLTVSSARGVVPRNTAKVTMFKAASYAGYKLCWPDDLVINSLWAWGGGLGVTSHHGIISTAYSVYRARPSAQVVPRFLHELVRSSAFNWELQVRSKGIWISRLQLTDTAFLDAPIPLPPPNEQAAIVRFLDHGNRKIDGFIRAKRKLIGLLNEQKQAIIHRAVTRGLNPNAPLKPSGIPWLGDIPQHWEVRAVGQLFDLSRGRVISHEEIGKNPGPYPVYSSQTANHGVMGYLRSYMFDGDFLTWTTDGAKAGTVFVRSGRFNCTNVCGTLKARFPLSLSFVRHALNRATSYYVRFDINPKLMSNVMARIRIPMPPSDEQFCIVDSVDGEADKVEQTVSQIEREIALMQEYRTRLTADVVTGKLDVRAAAEKLPDLTQEESETEPEEAEAEELEEAEA